METWSLRAAATLLLVGPMAQTAEAAAPSVHALTNVRVVVAPGETIDGGVVVFRDGILEEVGAGVEPPPDARVRDLEGLTVYPGLIDPYTLRSQAGSDSGEAAEGGPAGDRLVRPERDMTYEAIDAAAARKLREAGYTAAVVAPQEGFFRGTSVLVGLGDGPADESLLARDVAHNVTFRNNSFGQGYPTSHMGAVALFRQTLLDAAWYREAHAAWDRRPAQARPPLDPVLDELAPVAAGDQRVVIETRDARGTLRIAALVDELGLDALLVGNGQEYRWLDEIAASGLPHLLPLDFPEAPKKGEEDDLTITLEELRHWDLAPENPKRLLDAGLTVAFTTHELTEPKQIHERVARAVARGLTTDEALAATTTTPARLLGVERVMGRLDPGKIANLVVVEGDLFVEKPKIREVWVDGRRYEIEESKAAEVDPAGEWALTIITGDGQEIPVELEITGALPALAGTISGVGQSMTLTTVEVSGMTLEIAFDSTPIGMPGTITMSLDVEGDRLSGSGTLPGGAFSVEGTRSAAAPEGTR